VTEEEGVFCSFLGTTRCTIQFVIRLFVGYFLRGIGSSDFIGISTELATELRFISAFWELISLDQCKCAKGWNMFDKHIFQIVVESFACFR